MRREGAPGGARERQESFYRVSEDDVRWMLGEITDEQWEDALQTFADLRAQISKMQWFSAEPNSVSAARHGERWMELAFAPADTAQGEAIKEILGRLHIVPWEEARGNVPVLIVENRRDVALLRAGLIFDFLQDQHDRKEGERRLAEAKRAYDEQMKEWLDHVREMDERERAEREAEQQVHRAEKARRDAERDWNLRIDLEREELRQLREDERERRIAGFIAAIPRVPKEEFERPKRLPQDHYYRFGYPPSVRAPGRRTGTPEAIAANEPEDPEEIDEVLERVSQEFFAGRISDDDAEKGLEQASVRSAGLPILTLFPRKYEYVKEEGKKGFTRERATQQVLEDADIENIVRYAQEAGPKGREEAIRELALVYRTFILYFIREVRQRHPSADPDELLQHALLGLAYAVDHYQAGPDSSFRKYLVPCMEGSMRGGAANSQYGVLRVPEYVSGNRKKVMDAQRAVHAQAPEKPVDRAAVAKMLHELSVLRAPTDQAYDAFLRKSLSVYEEKGLDTLDGEDADLHDVDLLARSLHGDGGQDAHMDGRELRERMDKALLRLTPREERVVRKYFEVFADRTQPSGDVYEAVRDELAAEGEALTLEQLKASVRAATAYGNLRDPQVLAQLPPGDRQVAEAYAHALDSALENETLETVAEELGVTRERVRQILMRGLRRLKHPANSRLLKDFRQ